MRKAALQLGIVDRAGRQIEDACLGRSLFRRNCGIYRFPDHGRHFHGFPAGNLGLLLSGSIALMVGLIDDFGVLSPSQKLLGQTLAALGSDQVRNIYQTDVSCRFGLPCR